MIRMDEQRPHVPIGRIGNRESYDLALDLDDPAATKPCKMLTIIAFGDDGEDEPILVYRKAHPMHRGNVSDSSLTKHSGCHDASSRKVRGILTRVWEQGHPKVQVDR